MVVCIFNKAPETGGIEPTTNYFRHISGLAASHVLDLSRVRVTRLWFNLGQNLKKLKEKNKSKIENEDSWVGQYQH